MQIENSPSLFLPKLAAVLLIVVFLSGMVEFVCLAVTAKQSNYSITNETSKLFSTPGQRQAPMPKLTSEVDVQH